MMMPDLIGIKLRIYPTNQQTEALSQTFPYWSSELGLKADCLFPDSKEMELTEKNGRGQFRNHQYCEESLWSTGCPDLSLDIQLEML